MLSADAIDFNKDFLKETPDANINLTFRIFYKC